MLKQLINCCRPLAVRPWWSVSAIVKRLLPLLSIAFAVLTKVDVYGQVGLGTLVPWSHYSSAVDANGIRHEGKDYPSGKHAPWMDDIIEAHSPHYPYGDRVQHNQGRGIYRLTLDPQTGTVSNITILKSTGVGTLDGCALSAFRRWRWKPGKWKEVDMPVTFQLNRHPTPIPGGIALPKRS
jgi:TonB family protein